MRGMVRKIRSILIPGIVGTPWTYQIFPYPSLKDYVSEKEEQEPSAARHGRACPPPSKRQSILNAGTKYFLFFLPWFTTRERASERTSEGGRHHPLAYKRLNQNPTDSSDFRSVEIAHHGVVYGKITVSEVAEL